MNERVPSILIVSSITCFVYDYVINIADEAEFIWSQRRTWTTAAYFLTKLVTFTALVCALVAMRSTDLPGIICIHYSTFIGIASFVASMYADILLTFRLYYMYDRNKRLLAATLAIYAAIIVVSIVLSFLNFPSASDYSSVPQDGSCFVRLPWELPAAWLLCLGYQVFLGILAFAKVRQAYAHRRLLGVRASLLGLLVEGNLQYYLVIAASYATMTALTFLGPAQIGSYNLITNTTMGIFGPKLFRDMRGMLLPGGEDSTFSAVLFRSEPSMSQQMRGADEEAAP